MSSSGPRRRSRISCWRVPASPAQRLPPELEDLTCNATTPVYPRNAKKITYLSTPSPRHDRSPPSSFPYPQRTPFLVCERPTVNPIFYDPRPIGANHKIRFGGFWYAPYMYPFCTSPQRIDAFQHFRRNTSKTNNPTSQDYEPRTAPARSQLFQVRAPSPFKPIRQHKTLGQWQGPWFNCRTKSGKSHREYEPPSD